MLKSKVELVQVTLEKILLLMMNLKRNWQNSNLKLRMKLLWWKVVFILKSLRLEGHLWTIWWTMVLCLHLHVVKTCLVPCKILANSIAQFRLVEALLIKILWMLLSVAQKQEMIWMQLLKLVEQLLQLGQLKDVL